MGSPRRLAVLVAPVVLAALIAGCGGGSESSGTGSTAAQKTPAGNGQVQLEKVGDVGQSTQEEIDYVPAERVCGNNFGWSAFEGTNRLNHDQTPPNAVFPILTYTHDDGCSVTGGYVVRDRSLPALFGRYVYGDFCSGDLHSFQPATPRARDDRPVGLTVPSLSSFGEDNQGHIYVVSLDGPVYRLAQ